MNEMNKSIIFGFVNEKEIDAFRRVHDRLTSHVNCSTFENIQCKCYEMLRFVLDKEELNAVRNLMITIGVNKKGD